jgi:N-ethylmaleimide reductase
MTPMTSLFSPLKAGMIDLPNRIVMAPLTRARGGAKHVPSPVMTEYYAQRASAGLIITEATMIAADGCAFVEEGGLFNEACVAGWRAVTDEVHRRGGRIMVQLWHPGRAAHSALNGGRQPISSTDRAIQNDTIRIPGLGAQPYEIPRRLATEEIPGIVTLFGEAARRAKEAGFDGVQLHAAHGYLLDQFLRDSVNDRTDGYGGSMVNRAKLLLEVVDVVSREIGAGRVSVRISPLVDYNDIADSNPAGLVAYLATEFERRGLSFLELRHHAHELPAEAELVGIVRQHFHGVLMLNGGFDQARGEEAIRSGRADAIVYGKAFIGNPDLVKRFAVGAPLNAMDAMTLYGPDGRGYTDYPVLPS